MILKSIRKGAGTQSPRGAFGAPPGMVQCSFYFCFVVPVLGPWEVAVQ